MRRLWVLPLGIGLDYNLKVGAEGTDLADRAWARVRWTEARQVTDLLGWRPVAGQEPDPALPPQVFYEGLVSQNRLVQAAQFLAVALPRWEAVAWAARAVRDQRSDSEREAGEIEALKRALLWVQDPTDVRRRAAFDAAEMAPATSPERLAALAAYFSGGPVTPDDCEPIQAPHDAAGKLAAGAVLAAVFSGAEPFQSLGKRLEEGVALAGAGGS